MEKVETSEKNGIVEINEFKLWNDAKVVYPYIKKYLRSLFPDSLILQEFNRVDLTILDEEIPVEIQSTIIGSSNGINRIKHSQFEDAIRRQIEDNITNCGKCWFFFDTEYHRYLNKEANMSSISVNFDWFAKYVKEGKLKVFTIRYDGEIKELKYDDLNFIRKLSNTCNVEYDDDNRILNRNKIKIITNVLHRYNFTQEEIDKYRNEYDNDNHKNITFMNFLIKSADKRKKFYGYALNSLARLSSINNFLNMNNEYDDIDRFLCSNLGILKLEGSSNSATSIFIDKFNICQYFPGYLRTKEEWDRIKDGHYTASQLRELFMTYHLRMSGKQGNLFEY